MSEFKKVEANSCHGPATIHVIGGEADTRTSTGVEIRMHGVGDHAPYSALGRPGFEDTKKSEVVISALPTLPAHRLLLIGWSRANRRLTRTLSWYLLFPFTLVNVAGYMAPRRKNTAVVVRFCVGLTSVLLTVSLAAWVTVIAETVWRATVGGDDGIVVRLLLCSSGPALVLGVIAHRTRQAQADGKPGPWCATCHVVALLATAVLCYTRPASWHYPQSIGGRAVDPMAYLVFTTQATVLAVALILAISAIAENRRMPGANAGSSLAAAGLLLVVAVAILHTAGSLLRLVASYAITLVSAVLHMTPKQPDPADLLLLPSYEDLVAALRIDLLFGFLLVFLAILGASMAVAYGRGRAARLRGTPSSTSPEFRAFSSWHLFIHDISARLSYVVLATVTLTAGCWTALALGLDDVSPDAISLARRAVTAIAILLFVFLVVRRPESAGNWVKNVFQMIADIAGFWPRDLVPLAGASYREVLMEGVKSALDEARGEAVALVGHSQGSVICSWYVRRHLAPGQNRVTLLTCGSPLQSLYATFFPATFDANFFDAVAMRSAGGEWFNYWRKTDPIATELTGAGVQNRDVTERVGEPRFGHSEYWREAPIRADIERVLGDRAAI